jgi:hypothetical protein
MANTKGYGTSTPLDLAANGTPTPAGCDGNLTTSNAARLATMFPGTPYALGEGSYDFRDDNDVYATVAGLLHPKGALGGGKAPGNWAPEGPLGAMGDYSGGSVKVPDTAALQDDVGAGTAVAETGGFQYAAMPDVGNEPRTEDPKPDNAIASPGNNGLQNPSVTSPAAYKTLGAALKLGGLGPGNAQPEA